MTEKLNKIKATLNQVIKDGRKVNAENITGAINELEKFPMTKALLQSTRIGKVLNEVRKLTSGSFPSRIKSIIRAWQILLQNTADTDTVVIPCRAQNGVSPSCQSPATNCYPADSTGCSKAKLRRVNGSTASLPALDNLARDGTNHIGSPSSPASSINSNLTDLQYKKKKNDSKLSVKKRMRLPHNNSFSETVSLDTDSRSPPTKFPRLNTDTSVTSLIGNGGIDVPASSKADIGKPNVSTANETNNIIPRLRIRFGGENGKSAISSVVTPNKGSDGVNTINNSVLSPVLTSSATKTFQHVPKDTDPSADTLSAVSGSTNRSTRQQVATPTALPRVKSTAELLIQYGTDIKGQKKTNILEIEREPDFVPSALPESARPRRLRTNAVSANRGKSQSGANSTAPSSSQDLSVIDSAASFKRGKSSILEKFLASTVKYSDNDESDKDISTSTEPARYAVTNFVVNSAPAVPVTSPTMSAPLRQISPTSSSKPVLPYKVESVTDQDTKMEDSETPNETVTDEADVKRKHHKHRHKHERKRHKVKNKDKVNTTHPITNLMDRRPLPLPQLPDVNPANYPYPLPSPAEVTRKNVDRLLGSTWVGMNSCSHGDTGEPVPHKEMYTLGLHHAAESPDSVLHMLPWVDLNGWQRQYFPENSLKYIDEFRLAKPR